jgi:hypothetical protein
MVVLNGFVTIEGEPEFIAKLHAMTRLLVSMCPEAALAGAKAGVAKVASAPPFTSRTGKLAKGRAKLLIALQDGAVAEMRWPAKYASFVDRGTEPHEIHPKLSGEGPLRGKNTTVRAKDGHQFSRTTQRRRSKNDVGTTRIALRWMGVGGTWIFARVVHHPGTKPADFSSVAQQACLDAALPVIWRTIRAVEQMWEGT